MKCKILVADDHELVRRGLHALFDALEDTCVCADAADGYEAVRKAHELRPDVIILDPGMPRLNGICAARQILKANPRQRIIMFASDASETALRLTLSTGIKGFVFKNDPLTDLIEAVNAVRMDHLFFSGQVGKLILPGYLAFRDAETTEIVIEKNGHLTNREIQIVQLLAEGKCCKEVADILGMSVKTAETHRSNLMRKLKIHNLPELVLYSIRTKIIEVPVFDTAPPAFVSEAYAMAA